MHDMLDAQSSTATTGSLDRLRADELCVCRWHVMTNATRVLLHLRAVPQMLGHCGVATLVLARRLGVAVTGFVPTEASAAMPRARKSSDAFEFGDDERVEAVGAREDRFERGELIHTLCPFLHQSRLPRDEPA